VTIRFALLAVALCAAAPGLAEGPGTRIRSGSDMPRLLDSLRRTESGPCERLRGEAKHRCLEAARKPSGSDRAPGPARRLHRQRCILLRSNLHREEHTT